MTNILYLAKDDFFLNVIELTLQNYQTNIEFSSPNDFSTTKLKDKDLVILDSSFNGNPLDIIKTFTATNIPVIFLYDELNAPESLPEGEKVLSIPQTFIEEKLIDSIQKFCKLEPKSGDDNMDKVDEKSQEQIEENGDVIELTDIIDENEISDIFSTEEAKKEMQDTTDTEETPLDTFDEVLENEEEIKLDELSEKEEETENKQDFDIVEEEDTQKLEKEPSETIMEKHEETIEATSEKKEEEDVPSVDELSNEEVEQTVQEDIQEETDLQEEKEEIKIPVDEETIKLAKEIEEDNISDISEPVVEEIKKDENIASTSPEGENMKKQDEEKTINISSIETKLFQASEKVLEAIEEATIEIAKGIAKVTPKIIEEVSKEIIPRIAQRIISEEITKQFNNKLNDKED